MYVEFPELRDSPTFHVETAPFSTQIFQDVVAMAPGTRAFGAQYDVLGGAATCSAASSK